MPDEEIQQNDQQNNQQDNQQDYIAEIQRLRSSTVPMEQYQRLLDDNKRLIHSLASGETGEAEGASAGATLEELRKKLSNPEDMTNLEYVTAALELREKVMEAGGDDPFLPNGTHARATAADREAAERVAAVMQECVEAADGNDGVFTAQLMARTYDPQLRR